MHNLNLIMRKYQQAQREKHSIKLLISLCVGKWCFPGGSDSKEFTCEAGGPGSIPGLGISPGGGCGSPLQYSCLENPHGQRSLVGLQRVGNDWVTKHSGRWKCESLSSCLTLCNLMDCSLPDSSVHGILQARILEWIAIPFSRGSSQPRDRTWVSCTAGRFFTVWATREGTD